MDLREQACWLLLVFESGLSRRIVNDILAIWCKQLGRSLQDFFDADAQEWIRVCRLKTEIIQKLEQIKEKRIGQAFLAEQLQHSQIQMITVLDPTYPDQVKKALGRSQIPSVLFAMGDMNLLKRQTIAIIGSRNANEKSLSFTRSVAHYLAEKGTNVISGYARGVDRVAYEGATSTDGYTTIVLPHGIRKLSKVQMRDLLPRIEAGKVLVLSQFHPDVPWLVSRAMERNSVVTGLAQVVIVAESASKGGTWEGAQGALKQGRRLYVREADATESILGNKLLLEKGGRSLPWPTEKLNHLLASVLSESHEQQTKWSHAPQPLNQLSLLALPIE